ncbi:MAG TPA: ubiquitin-like domain-containing protein [Anaerolineales bacterium]|nr:ubiquitin-like domain-containing protein [Anaerolineales bacterium]
MSRWTTLLGSKIAILRLLVAILAVAGVTLIAVATASPVTVRVDGRSIAMHTHARTVAGALHDAGIRLYESDRVLPGLDHPLAPGAVIEVQRARPVVLDVDGAIAVVRTTLRHPADILAEAGWTVFPGDRVWADGLPVTLSIDSAARPPTRVRMERSVTLTLNERGGRRPLASAAATIGEALWDAGVRLRDGDDLVPAAGTALAGPTGVSFVPARPMTVSVDGESLQTFAAPRSVGEALAQAGLGLVGMDRAVPALNEPVPADGLIKVVRVREDVELREESIPFTSTFEAAPEIEIDHQQLVDTGAEGIRAERVRVRVEDGVEVSRFSEGEWVAQEPRPRVMGYGTKIVVRTLNTPNGPIEYWRAVTMYATSYSPCRLGTDYCNANLASGGTLQHGIVAVLLRWYRSMRGMHVYVPGYGVGRIADTGGGIPGRFWIDLGYSDDDYISWHNWVTVYFLTPVPPEGLIQWVLD